MSKGREQCTNGATTSIINDQSITDQYWDDLNKRHEKITAEMDKAKEKELQPTAEKYLAYQHLRKFIDFFWDKLLQNVENNAPEELLWLANHKPLHPYMTVTAANNDSGMFSIIISCRNDAPEHIKNRFRCASATTHTAAEKPSIPVKKIMHTQADYDSLFTADMLLLGDTLEARLLEILSRPLPSVYHVGTLQSSDGERVHTRNAICLGSYITTDGKKLTYWAPTHVRGSTSMFIAGTDTYDLIVDDGYSGGLAIDQASASFFTGVGMFVQAVSQETLDRINDWVISGMSGKY